MDDRLCIPSATPLLSTASTQAAPKAIPETPPPNPGNAAPAPRQAALLLVDTAVQQDGLALDAQLGVLAVAMVLATRRLVEAAKLNPHQRATLFRKIGQGVTDRLQRYIPQ